jgi:TatD DNase family protein
VKLFDSHAHLDMAASEADARAQLDRAWAAGLEGIVAIGGATRVGDFDATLSLAIEDPRIYAAVGVPPHAASAASDAILDGVRRALDQGGVVALGETGLDYHYNRSTPAEQRRAFIRQLRIARDAALPVIVHTRNADSDTLAILRDEGAEDLGGVIHCFSSGKELAEGALALGFHLSFSGIVTFPNADETRGVAAAAPRDRILAETDAPFLSPVPFRGQSNEPSRVLHMVEKLAELRGVPLEEMAATTVENARRCFRIETVTTAAHPRPNPGRESAT